MMEVEPMRAGPQPLGRQDSDNVDRELDWLIDKEHSSHEDSYTQDTITQRQEEKEQQDVHKNETENRSIHQQNGDQKKWDGEPEEISYENEVQIEDRSIHQENGYREEGEAEVEENKKVTNEDESTHDPLLEDRESAQTGTRVGGSEEYEQAKQQAEEDQEERDTEPESVQEPWGSDTSESANLNHQSYGDDEVFEDAEEEILSQSNHQASTPYQTVSEDRYAVVLSGQEDSQTRVHDNAVQQSELPDRSPSRLDDDHSGDEYGDDGMTDDQRQAMQELQKMRLDLAYTAEDNPPPEYDVSERVRQLNEELANEPPPAEDERERTITFKENLVDLVAPPPDYSDEEEEEYRGRTQMDTQDQGQNNIHQNSDSGDPNDLKMAQMELNDDQALPESTEIQQSKPEASKGGEHGDKVLIERDGKFEFVNSEDLKASDLGGFGLAPEVAMLDESGDGKKREESQKSGAARPAPPSKPRPGTANGSARLRQVRGQPQRRARSAQIESSSDPLEGFSYNSPYALSDKEKDTLKKQKNSRAEREKREKEKKKKEEESLRMENDDAFHAWLQTKRKAQQRQREEELERQKAQQEEQKNQGLDNTHDTGSSNDEKRKPEDVYKEWLQHKREQKRKEQRTEHARHRESQEAFFTRSRIECDKAYRQDETEDENSKATAKSSSNDAFKKWLRKKNAEARKARAENRKKTTSHKLLAKRSRKYQALANAIRQSQSFQYVDYYGYRF